MSMRSLPILFMNMGGEMVYILEQRLTAQNVKRDKASRVLTDIVSTMFSDKLTSQLFQGQEIYSRRTMRALFDKLAHTSIMRLNTTSMDKLFDLMTMAVKYQLVSTRTPQEMLLLTLNHFDGIRKIIEFSQQTTKLIDQAYKQFADFYFHMSQSELLIVKQTVLDFFQDTKVKVSILLRENKQLQSGYFFIQIDGPCGERVKPPGTMCIFGANGAQNQQKSFSDGGRFQDAERPGCTDRLVASWGRSTELGKNMYLEYTSSSSADSSKTPPAKGAQPAAAKGPPVNTSEELKLLNLLIGTEADAQPFNFNVDFLNDDTNESGGSNPKTVPKSKSTTTSREPQKVVKVDASQRKVDLDMEGLNVKENVRRMKSQGEELLDMMDSAE